MKPGSFVIASHVYYADKVHDVHGPAHTVYDFLVKKNLPVVFIKHCIETERPSVIVKGNKERTVTLPRKSFWAFIKKFWVGFLAIPKSNITYIGVDPFNGLVGVVGKITGRVTKLIYYTPDFTDKRYENIILNALYYGIDRMCVRFADEVWAVSSRIQSFRKSQGIPAVRNKLVPNTPDVSSVPRHAYDGNRTLIIVSNVAMTLYIPQILDAVKTLRKRYPDVRLLVFGGRETNTIMMMVRKRRLQDVVRVSGHRSHKEVLEAVARSFLGFALYTPVSRGTYWGDSMKAREYVACGIPVIINTLPSTSEDIQTYKAGIVLEHVTANSIQRAVEQCIRNPRYYETLRKNALILGRTYDKAKLLTRLLLRE